MSCSDPSTSLVVGSLCTIIYEFGFGTLLEIFKIQQQTTNLSILEIYDKLTSQKGLFGLWDGFFPWGFIMSASKGASFSFGRAWALKLLIFLFVSDLASNDAEFEIPKTLYILASPLGGIFQGIIMSPLLLLKTRVVTHDKFRKCEGILYIYIYKQIYAICKKKKNERWNCECNIEKYECWQRNNY